MLIETIYESEHDATPDQIRRQAWQAMLSGAAGQFFGNNPIWHFDGPTLYPFTGDWKQALDRPTLQFTDLAKGMGVPGGKAHDLEELTKQLTYAMSQKGPYLIDVIM